MPNKWEHLKRLKRAVGLPAAASILFRRVIGLSDATSVRAGGHKIKVRPCDSDLFVLGQIFGEQEYEIGRYKSGLNNLALQWKESGINPVVLDIGANVGYSALYFADIFPHAIVCAVEANRSTFDLLIRNVGGHPRIRAVHAAVWFHEQGVELVSAADGVNGAGSGSWASKVKDGRLNLTPSLLLRSTYKQIPNARPLVVKLDVEGAEREICEAAFDVLSIAPCILVEPHDFMLPGHSCLRYMLSALAGRAMDTLIQGENLMFVDSNLAGAV